MTDDAPLLPEEEARRLWQRAAELQAEAARAAEQGSTALVQPDEQAEGYSLQHVREAARGAGISPEFVDLAVEEARAGARPEVGSNRLADRFLGKGARWISASRRYEASAEALYAAMQRVFPTYPLTLVDTRGGEPLAGGVMVFDLPAMTATTVSTDRIMRDLYQWADVRELHVGIRPLDGDRCEVNVRAPLASGRRLVTYIGIPLVGVAGLLSALLGGAVGQSIMEAVVLQPLVESLLPVVTAVLGAGAGGGGGLSAWRRLHRGGTRRGRVALERLLQALGMDVRTGGAFRKSLPGALPSLPGVGEERGPEP